MRLQCSARLTLIWLSGSALPLCQAVWAVVKLFEGGWRRGVVCLCQAEMGCRDARAASVPRLFLTLTHTHTALPHLPLCFTTAGFSVPASAHSASFLLPVFLFLVFHFLRLSHMQRQALTHTRTHFLLFLSKASLKELWLCGLEKIQTLRVFCWVFPLNY